jgi:tetratricopeptide (TPR) repeat protein
MDVLDHHAEEEWARLRTQLELGGGGAWVGFVFAPAPTLVDVLRERSEGILRRQTKTLRYIRPQTPDQLRSLLNSLLAAAAETAGCLWIDALVDSREWNDARDAFLVRLNEHREALLRRLTGGVVFAFPRDAKPHVREVAPDLWAIRTIVLHLEPSPEPDLAIRPRIDVPAETMHGAEEGELALMEAQRMLREERFPEAVRLFNRAADIYSKHEAGNTGRVAAEAALELAEREVAALVPASLASLAGAELADGDPAAAIDHMNRAISEAEAGHQEVEADWFVLLGRAQTSQGRASEALDAFNQAVARFRDRDSGGGVALSLIEAGNAAWDAVGDVAARRYYEEGAGLLRRLVAARSADEEVVASLVSVLLLLAHLLRLDGALDEAQKTVAEALDHLSRLRRPPDRPRLSELLAHQILAKLAFDARDWPTARTESERVLAGVSPHLTALGAALAADAHVLLAAVADAEGNRHDARRHAESAINTRRAVVAKYGETPDILSGMIVTLTSVATYLDEDQNEALLREALDLARRVFAAVGRSAHAVAWFAHALFALAGVLFARGKDEEAARLLHEREALIEESPTS